MFARAAMGIAVVVLAACGGSSPTAGHSSPTASGAPATASATAAGTPSSSSGPGSASLVHCSTPVPAGDNLVLGAVVGDPTVVVRDIQDPANAKNLCTFESSAQAPLFVN